MIWSNNSYLLINISLSGFIVSNISAKPQYPASNNMVSQRKTQQNSRCRLCGDRDETINPIISECSKLEQKEYKIRHDWVEKVIYRELCKEFKFEHTDT